MPQHLQLERSESQRRVGSRPSYCPGRLLLQLEGNLHVDLVPTMLPSSIVTFMSLTHAPCTPLKVLVARATAWSMASSKPCSEMALSSVTLAMLMRSCLPDR